MYSLDFLDRVRTELEAPREERAFGSGWLSGSIGLLAGTVGLLMVIVLRNPTAASVPQLAAVHDSVLFRLALYFVLVSGFVLAALSLVLRRAKTLGGAAMLLTLVATMIGSLPAHRAIGISGVYFGLDFFILNVLFTGLLFIPVEQIFGHRREQPVFREEWREDLFYYLVSSLLVQILTFLTMAPSNVALQAHDFASVRAWVHDLPWIVQLIAIMLLTDFVQYWVHRAFHRVPFLWGFHAVHHSAKSMDWIAGARMHFLEIVMLRSLTATPMLVLGFHESAIQAYLLIVYVYSTFIHSNVGAHFGVLEKIVVLPRFHHWHHGIEQEAVDVNFAIHFPFLDRLFGTHHLPEDRWPNGYGVAGHPVPNGYWRQFLYPFRR